MNLSKNGLGLIVLALSVIGVQVTEAATLEFIFHVTEAVSYILLIWNQVTRSDVYNFLFKSKE